jgi:hypothetical protein
LLLNAPHRLHLLFDALCDLSLLGGHLHSLLANDVARDRDRRGDALQRQLGDRLVSVGAQDEANRRAIRVVGDEFVNVGVDVQVHLAGELCLEGADLEVDHDEPASRMVVEQQVGRTNSSPPTCSDLCRPAK